MSTFDLTANINARLNTSNVRAIANQLRSQLAVTTTVNIKLANSTTRGVAGLTKSLSILNKELINIAANSTSANKSLNQLGNSFTNIVKQLGVLSKGQQNLNNITSAAKNAGSQMEQFGRQAGLAFRRFAGFRIATGLISGFVGQITSAVREAISFQRELVRISQVTGRSLASLSSLQKEITNLSTNLGVASSDLVNISRILSQAGLSANQTEQALEALAKTTLAPTFTDINKTAEGAIAIFRQFGLQANQLKAALGAINAVSGQFAVESDDIIAAVKRAGGVFAATSEGVSEGIDALNEFIAVFTSVRATTREGAETIATGLRTIFTRIQRPTTIAFLQELGVNLTDVEGKFVGPFKAITAISSALKNLDTRDPQFAKLVEELGGFRQVGKVIPLLTEQETRIKALQVAQKGLTSLDKDSETAQQALAVQIQKVREELVALIRNIADTSTFKAFVKITLDLASSLIKLADAFRPIIPLLGAFVAFKGASAITQFSKGLLGKGGIRFHNGGFVRRRYAEGGDIHPNGIVPGGRGVGDDVNATLQSGEFVIRRKAVDAIGRQNLNKINRTGRFPFAEGGLAGQSQVGAAILYPFGDKQTASILVKQSDVPSLDNPTKSYTYKRSALDKGDKDVVTKAIIGNTIKGITEGARNLAGTSFSPGSAKKIFDTSNPAGVLGSMFEGILLAINNNGLFDQSLDPNRPFDFSNGFNSTLGRKFDSLRGIQYIDAKVSDRAAQPAQIRKKVIQQLNLESGGNKKQRPKSTKTLEIEKKRQEKLLARQKKLGLKFAGGGQVPALLTRGEFVINKRTARALGGPALHALNNADRAKYASGGFVGRQKFASGGSVGSALKKLLEVLNNPNSQRSGFDNLRRIPRRVGLKFFGKNNVQRLQNNKAALGFGALTLSSQLGGTAGSSISGGVTGAALGSSFGGVGAAVGAVVGAILGGFSAFTQSKIDKQIQESTDSITKSIKGLDSALNSFNKSGNFSVFEKALNDVNNIFDQTFKATSAQAGPASGTRFENFSRGYELQQFAKFFSTINTGGGISTRAESFVSASAVKASEERRFRTQLQIGQDAKSQTSAYGEAVLTGIEDQIRNGGNINDILNNLSGGATVALASSLANTGELAALGGADNAEERILIAKAQLKSNIQLTEGFTERVKLEEKLKRAMESSNISINTFVNDLEDIGAAIERSGNAGIGFSRINAANIGNGIIDLAQENPFANPRAFSDAELRSSAVGVVSGLGGIDSSIGKEIVKGLGGFNNLTTKLPSVLAQVAGRSSAEEQGQAIEKAVLQNFGDLPKSVIDKLLAGISFNTEISDQSTSLRQFAENDARSLAEQIGKPLLEVGKKYIEVQNNAIKEYQGAVGQWIDLQRNANALFDQTVLRDIENQNTITALDRNLTFDELTKGFVSQQTSLAKRAGAGGSDLNSILARLREIDARRGDLENRSTQFAGGFGAGKQLTDEMANLVMQQQSAEEVLKNIASNTQITAAATQKLQEIENAKKTAQQLAEEFVTADPLDRFKQQRQLSLANALQNGAQFTGQTAADALQGIRRQAGLRGQTGDEADRIIRESLSGNALVRQLFTGSGRTAREALVESPEERRLRDILEANRISQRQAGNAVSGRAQDNADKFANNANQRFAAIIDSLLAISDILKNFKDSVASLPPKIDIGGSVALDVRITGAEALASIKGDLGKLVDQKIQSALRQQIDSTDRIENLTNA